MTRQAEEIELLSRIELGLDAERFMMSNLGKSIVKRASIEVNEALMALKAVDCNDSRAIRELQTKIEVAELGIVYLLESINAGSVAEEQINNNQE
ncbi:hypothetical protein ED236_00455 [Pseudomethylobacillus aquaticus]|uniref:Uncharacterized protein n=1 Tax=Pseudomethylobacillus aquaticus TaxID=2676064 RepID=A0A3N0V5F7_9PROT|nr:hypothetical protein [Pseudomethylobacillus aquaticus]ROH87999.1 hypothetical protein ED236_00455 [Pseudomethylobacillus aquaticus]